MGDVDFDGAVTASDARLVLRASSHLEALNDLQKAISDVDYDDYVTAGDAQIILKMSVGG